MGGFKKQLFEDRAESASLDRLADRLHGEVDGRLILCASPGRPDDDRSMSVRMNPDNPGLFYIYYCDGPVGTAYAHVRRRLGITAQPVTKRNREYVEQIWEEAVTATGALVERYLRGRQITGPVPAALRYHRFLRHSSGAYLPAMVAGIFDKGGDLCAVHRTFLRHDGSGKAPVEPDKMTLGPIGGRAVQLAPAGHQLIVAEGIETALSASQLRGVGAWAAMSATGLRAIELPVIVRQVIIAADGDAEGKKAAMAACKRFLHEGRACTIWQAPDGQDFNDLLKSKGAQ